MNLKIIKLFFILIAQNTFNKSVLFDSRGDNANYIFSSIKENQKKFEKEDEEEYYKMKKYKENYASIGLFYMGLFYKKNYNKFIPEFKQFQEKKIQEYKRNIEKYEKNKNLVNKDQDNGENYENINIDNIHYIALTLDLEKKYPLENDFFKHNLYYYIKEQESNNPIKQFISKITENLNNWKKYVLLFGDYVDDNPFDFELMPFISYGKNYIFLMNKYEKSENQEESLFVNAFSEFAPYNFYCLNNIKNYIEKIINNNKNKDTNNTLIYSDDESFFNYIKPISFLHNVDEKCFLEDFNIKEEHKNENTFILHEICVKNSFRGRKLGSYLLKKTFKNIFENTNCNLILLKNTFEGNPPFYKKNGMKPNYNSTEHIFSITRIDYLKMESENNKN